MSLHVLIGHYNKAHTEPRIANHRGDKHECEDSIIAFGDPTLLGVDVGLEKIETEVYEEGVLEDGVNHSGDLAAWGIIPVGTDLEKRNNLKISNTRKTI